MPISHIEYWWLLIIGSAASILILVFALVGSLIANNRRLKKERDYSKSIVETNPALLIVLDAEGKIVCFNRACQKITGYQASEVLSHKFNEFPFFQEERISLKTKKFPDHFESQLITKDRKKLTIDWTTTELKNTNSKWILSGIEITRKRKAVEALRKSEEKYRQLLSTITDAIMLFDASTKQFLEVNQACEELYGYSRKEFFKLTVYNITAEKEETEAFIKRTIKQGFDKFPLHYHKNKNGAIFPVEISTSTLVLEGRRVICGVVRDITERKLAEKKLQAIIRTVPDVIYRLDKNGSISFISEAITKYGHNPEELIGIPILELVHPEDREKAIYRVNERRTGYRSTKFLELQLFIDSHNGIQYETEPPNGPTFQIAAEGLYSSDEPQPETFIGTQGIARDITPFKQTEKALNESEEKFRLVVEAAPNSIIMVNKDGKIILANPQTEKVFGYQKQELIGQPVEVLIPKRFRAKRQKYCSDFFANPQMQPMRMDRDIYGLHKDGTKFPIECGLSYILTSAGILALSEIVDITERKNAEMELKKSHEQLRNFSAHLQNAREEERKHIAREIHDELGQELTVMKINLSLLNTKIAGIENSELRETVFKETKSLSKFIDKAVNSIRRIVSNLRPEFLEELGLTHAIQKYLKQFKQQTKIRCYLKSNLEDQKIDLNLSLAIFRVFQESLINVARHAKASKVNITLNHGTRNLLLKVKDNGKGIAERDINNSKSLGLIGMQERASTMGGKLNITGILNKGTTITLKIPVNKTNGILSSKPMYENDNFGN